MVQAVEESLKRLKTDYIDLYWLHAWDFMTPIEEVMRGLDDLVRAGKVLYIGISDTPAWIVSRANTMADLRNWTSFTGLQIEYSLIERTVERELVPMARELDLAILAWSPLGSGLLSGKYRKTDGKASGRLAESSSRISDHNNKIVDTVLEIAAGKNIKPTQVALNWLRQSNNQVIPIVGARNVSQLKENIDCLSTSLTDSEMERLNEVSKIEPGFPHDFLSRERIQNIIFGGFQSKIDNHRK
jgi:aryl-alcohol dehydrogenase-like predicted oxidoreductase